MGKTYYRCAYGCSASIAEHRDGTATLRRYAGGKTERVECRSVTSAKRALSRWCDGCYEPVSQTREEGR